MKFATCFLQFTKAQRCNVLSWVRKELKKGKFDMKKFGMPPHFALAGSLVGAAMDDLKHEGMMEQYSNPREYQDKWIYPDELLQYTHDDPLALMEEAEWSLDFFFPVFSDFDTLDYDCLPKTVNQALGFLFFSHRQQVVRLMRLHHRITVD